MQFSKHGCLATCAFCPQSRISRSRRDLLSRVLWPCIDIKELISKLPNSNVIRRICLQTVIKRGFIAEAINIVSNLRDTGKNISIAITPTPKPIMKQFLKEGVDHVGIGLDAATKELFVKITKPFSWRAYWEFIKEMIKLFGEFNVSVHIIVGLGENPLELINTIYSIKRLGANTSLFAFTPIKGTPLGNKKAPDLRYYRFVQLATMLIYDGHKPKDFIVLKEGKVSIKKDYIDINNYFLEKTLLTRGCPYCNRPFYNEVPGKEPYNFPSLSLVKMYKEYITKEIEMIIREGIPIVRSY